MPPKAHCILQHRGRRVIRQIKVFRGEIQSASFSEKLELLSHCKYLMPTGRDPGEVLLGQLWILDLTQGVKSSILWSKSNVYLADTGAAERERKREREREKKGDFTRISFCVSVVWVSSFLLFSHTAKKLLPQGDLLSLHRHCHYLVISLQKAHERYTDTHTDTHTHMHRVRDVCQRLLQSQYLLLHSILISPLLSAPSRP